MENIDVKLRYSKEELKEFEALIRAKLDKAYEELQFIKDALNRSKEFGTEGTVGNVKVLEDGADTIEKESLHQLAARQQKFIKNLNNALIRIKNGTYGVCKDTGVLIPKQRLKAVPHTTQTIEAKMRRR